MMKPVNDLHPDYIGKVVKIRLVPRASTGTGELGEPDFARVEDFVGTLQAYVESKSSVVVRLEGISMIHINPKKTFVDMLVREEHSEWVN